MSRSIELEQRTRDFAIRIVRLFRALPHTPEAQIIGKQFLRAGTSVGANYRAAQRARSNAEFVSKLSVVIEEADEVAFWLQLLVDTNTMPENRLKPLIDESSQLVAIFIQSSKTVRERKTNLRD